MLYDIKNCIWGQRLYIDINLFDGNIVIIYYKPKWEIVSLLHIFTFGALYLLKVYNNL